MVPFIKKDLLVFWRDRKETLISLLLPIVLIIVLNFAFSDLLNEDAASVHIDVAIVQEDDESAGLEQFKEKVKQGEYTSAEEEMLFEQAAVLAPISLIHGFFHDQELKEWVTAQELSEVEARGLVENGELDAIIKIPRGYTNDVLSSIILGEHSELSLIIQTDEQSAEVNALQDIIHSFIDTLNLQYALGSTAGNIAEVQELPQGGRELLEGVETFTMPQYFTIAMSTLFALFMAQTVAMKTVTEKRERVFNRILLTNSNPLKYLMGKTTSTFYLSWLQMMITFTAAQLLLDVFPGKSFAFWCGLVLIVTAFALTVAGLSALFTAITLNINNLNAVSGNLTLIIMGLGVLGGSFFPIQGMPELLQIIGEWTPNGLTQTILIEWIQFGDIKQLVMPMLVFIAFFAGFLAIAMFSFPKRGRI